MESDLISRSAVLETMDKYIDMAKDDEMHHALCVMAEGINDLPTLDAVPVVRCRDCKHRGGYNCPMYHTETSLDDLDGFDEYAVDRTADDGYCEIGRKRNAQTD